MNIGTRIKFKENEIRDSNYDGDKIVPVYEINVPEVKHGSTTMRMDEYNKKGCEIIHVSSKLYTIKVPTTTLSNDGFHDKGYTTLGFYEYQIVPLFKITKKKLNNL